MKTLDELMALADEYVRTHMKHERAAVESALRELIADAERMQWLRSAKNLDLRWMPSEWRRPDGSMFVAPYLLRAGDTQYAPEESLDAAIDAARKG